MGDRTFQEAHPALQACVTELEDLTAALRRGEWEREFPSSAEAVAFHQIENLCERYLNLVEAIDSLRRGRY